MSSEEGRIVRSISGFYDVFDGQKTVRLRARGNFRKKGIIPKVGDIVRYPNGEWIEEILPRQNDLERPAVANIDQAVLVLACRYPEPSFLLLERFIAAVRLQKITPVLIFNKSDQLEGDTPEDREIWKKARAYRTSGFTCLLTSVLRKEGLDEVEEMLKGKISVFSGPSGVGKSSLLNEILGEESQEVGELSERIQRGKNTTRVSELLPVRHLQAWVADTPGFTSLHLTLTDIPHLQSLYPEWKSFAEKCAYPDCTHTNEPGCGVREALEAGKLEKVRYEGYCSLMQEEKEKIRRNESREAAIPEERKLL